MEPIFYSRFPGEEELRAAFLLGFDSREQNTVGMSRSNLTCVHLVVSIVAHEDPSSFRAKVDTWVLRGTQAEDKLLNSFGILFENGARPAAMSPLSSLRHVNIDKEVANTRCKNSIR